VRRVMNEKPRNVGVTADLAKIPLMTAATLLLDGRADHGAIRAENAAVARLRLKQCLAVRALVEILTRVRRHDFFAPLPAARAADDGL
jgi:hypothetical protein